MALVYATLLFILQFVTIFSIISSYPFLNLARNSQRDRTHFSRLLGCVIFIYPRSTRNKESSNSKSKYPEEIKVIKSVVPR